MSKSLKPSGTKPSASKSKPDVSVTIPDKQANMQPDTLPFPVVGLGASAGGLEALELFLGRVSSKSGMAYIVIQHLDPTQKGMMPELLERTTTLNVQQAEDGLKVKPNHVYVIPPNTDLSILHGVLHLIPPVERRGLRLPIDYFFRALADDQREYSVGVILSGMGSDGTLGVRAIKEHAGLVLVQDPASAKFNSMPQSVISAGLADIIASAQDIPAKIEEFFRHTVPVSPVATEPENEKQNNNLDKIFIQLRSRTGHDFSLYKKSTIGRRIERRMGLHQIVKIADYGRYLQENPEEIDLLFKELLIGVTSFFRDPATWTYLQTQTLPAYMTAYPNGRQMRAWVAGCSTGEEAYSLAITFKEIQQQIEPSKRFTLQIFATDLDSDAIERARQGYYPANIAADVSAERLSRFFVEEGSGYRVSKEIREMIVFAPQNVIMDPPFTRLDILTCRNLLIYLGSELQQKLLPLFHYCLNPGGILFLGSAESASNYPDLYTSSKNKIYRRSGTPIRVSEVNFPSRLFPVQTAVMEEPKALPAPINLQSLADAVLLQQFLPAAVMINSEGDILYISGHTGKYLEPAAGKANWNIYVMAREGLREELSLLIPRALREKTMLTHKGIHIGTNGGTQVIDLCIQVIEQPDVLRGHVMIVFNDVATPRKKHAGKHAADQGRDAELKESLAQAQSEAQKVREEMQSQQEEVKSTNEELQSTNEELQSTNEELTTSKEEMQSLNEELQTVNIELRTKVDDMSTVNNDMKNLLDSTKIATIFLDIALMVRLFTPQATKIFKLIEGDIGRPLSDLMTDLKYPALLTDAQEVLRTLMISEKQICTRDGHWFSVKIIPYRTTNNVIDGVVITFIDINAIKQAEQALREIFNATSVAMFIHEAASGRIIDVNDAMLQMYGFDSREDAMTNNVSALSDVEAGFTEEERKKKITKVLEEGPQVLEARACKKNGNFFWQEISLCRITINGADHILATARDITERKLIDEALSVLQQRFTDQTAKLESSQALEVLLNKAQAILEKRVLGQTEDLKQSRSDLKESRSDLKESRSDLKQSRSDLQVEKGKQR